MIHKTVYAIITGMNRLVKSEVKPVKGIVKGVLIGIPLSILVLIVCIVCIVCIVLSVKKAGKKSDKTE